MIFGLGAWWPFVRKAKMFLEMEEDRKNSIYQTSFQGEN